MLCLSRTVGVWCNEIVPTLMARLTQIGLRPTVGLIVKNVPRRPMMILRPFSATYLANKWQLKREHFFYFDVGFFNGFTFGEPRYSFPAIHAIERVSRLSARVNVMANTPSCPPAMFAWMLWVVNFIFP